MSQMCGLYSKNWERIALEDSIFLLVVMRKAVCIMGKILLDKINLQIHSIGKVTKIKRGVGKLIFLMLPSVFLTVSIHVWLQHGVLQPN